MTEETKEQEASAVAGGQNERLVMPDYYPEHNTNSEECWCEPEIKLVDDAKIIIHRRVH